MRLVGVSPGRKRRRHIFREDIRNIKAPLIFGIAFALFVIYNKTAFVCEVQNKIECETSNFIGRHVNVVSVFYDVHIFG